MIGAWRMCRMDRNEWRDGVPVWGSVATAMVREDPGHMYVWASDRYYEHISTDAHVSSIRWQPTEVGK